VRRARGALVLALAVLGGCSTAAPAAGPGTLTVLAVGDSITEADSPDFDDGNIGAGSWARYASRVPVRVLGGWAHAGATSGDMLTGVSLLRVDDALHPADVLVLMAGSNDVDVGVPFAQVARHLRAIVRVVAIRRVVVSLIPPEDAAVPAVQTFNEKLTALAHTEDWELVDPMTGIRDDDGHYAHGMTDDGVHPTVRAARLIGEDLRRALVG
jgi:lysophospholipase L1-like esterase